MNICFCAFLFALIAIMFVPLFFKGHRFPMEIAETISNEIPIYTHKIHLNDDFVGVVVNKTHDACLDHFNYACNTGVSTLLQSINTHNEKCKRKIREEYIKQTPFYEKCTKFHQNRKEFTYTTMLSSTYYKDTLHILNSLDNHEKLESVLGKLFRIGIKVLFEVSYVYVGDLEDYVIQRAPKIASAKHHKAEVDAWKSFERTLLANFIRTSVDGVSLQDAIAMDNVFESTNGDIYRTEQYIGPFKFKDYLIEPTKTINYIESDLLSEFDNKKTLFSIDQWKNYLHVGIIYNILLRYRMGVPKVSETCVRQYEQLFPLGVCEHIKKMMDIDVYQIKGMFKSMRNGYIKWMTKNKYGHSATTVTATITRLNDLVLIVNDCWLKRDKTQKEYVLKMEQKNVNHTTQHTEYQDIIYDIFKSDISLYRNEDADRYLRNLDETFLTFSGGYNRYENSLTVSPGLVHFFMTEMSKDGCIFDSFMSCYFGHEIGHMIYRELMALEPNNIKFNSYLDTLRSVYGFEYFKEIVADSLGSEVAFEYIFKPRSEEDKKCFFLTCIKLWCKETSLRDHPPSKVREEIVVNTNKKEYNNLFCK